MKFLIGVLFLFSLSLNAQEKDFSIIPNKFSLISSFQNEDIFISLASSCNIKEWLAIELRYGVGTRRTFFQKSLFSKIDLVLKTDVLKKEFWVLGPSVQFSIMRLSPRLFSPIQLYSSAEIGYNFALGNKLKMSQSSYLGYRKTRFANVSKRYLYLGYAIELGLCYEL